jgi:predicted flap endonuclease-1-like 5' DNA nuclease
LPLIPELAPIPGITHPTPEQVADLLSPREFKSPEPTPRRAIRELPGPDDVEPFSFLLPDQPEGDFLGLAVDDEETAEPEPPLPLVSPLHAIAHAEPPAASVEAVAPPSITILPEVDTSLGMIYRQSPALVDDLTRVRGISPALQNRLQELGVYRLQQIAGWSPAHIREFSRRLAFKDRIERERWVEQARRLMDG